MESDRISEHPILGVPEKGSIVTFIFDGKEMQGYEGEPIAADLDSLRQGMFAPCNRGRLIEKTDEGIPVSMNLLTKGFVADEEIVKFPGFTRQTALHPVIES